MPLFEYKARTRRGEPVTGEMEAESADRVADYLFQSEITPVEIQIVAGGESNKGARKGVRWWQDSIKLDDLIMMCRQFHTLMRAGVPILRGLDTLIATTRNRTLADVLQEVSDDLRGGRDLASALARHPDVFTPLFINMIKVGENTGRLDESFRQLADYLELEKSTRNRVRSALRYPTMVIATIVVAIVIINIWVIPAFAKAFARFNSDLPLATQMLIATSHFFVNWWKEMLVTAVVGFVGFRMWLRTDDGDYAWSRFILRIPLVGGIILRAVLARFSRSVAMSIQSGVPLVQALTSVAGALGNAFIGERVLGMRTGIEAGESIARTAAATGLFTPLVLQMIAIGEETGTVDELLLETAEHYERDVDYELKRLTDAIEPLIIVIIGVMVLVLALGVFLPMWDLSSVAFKKG